MTPAVEIGLIVGVGLLTGVAVWKIAKARNQAEMDLMIEAAEEVELGDEEFDEDDGFVTKIKATKAKLEKEKKGKKDKVRR